MTTFAEANLAQAQYVQATATDPDVVSVGIGYLDPNDHSKGAALVVYTKKGLTRDQATALGAPVIVQIKSRQVQVPIRIEESGGLLCQYRSPGREIGRANRARPRVRQADKTACGRLLGRN